MGYPNNKADNKNIRDTCIFKWGRILFDLKETLGFILTNP